MTSEAEGTLDVEADFRALCSAFEHALTREPDAVTVSDCRFAGRPARLRIVGRALARTIERSFAHLWSAEEAGHPSKLRVDLWDASATGVGCSGCVPRPFDLPDEAQASPDGRFVIYHSVETRIGLDRARQHLVGWVGSSDRLTQYQRGRPLLSPLLLWLMDRGVVAAHAGLVALNGRGVLVGGPSGAGKSTVALACAQSGFEYLADDCVGLENVGDNGFLGHSLFCSANLQPDHLKRLASMAPHGIPGRLPSEDKSLLVLSDIVPGSLASTVPIRAVVLPQVRPNGRTNARPASRAEALLRLAPSSLYMTLWVRTGHGSFDKLVRLVESVPSYWLNLGSPDLDEIPRALAEILSPVELA